MTTELVALGVDAKDPQRLAGFWAAILGWEPTAGAMGAVELIPDDETGLRIRFRPTTRAKTVKNRMHFDLTSISPTDQQHTVARSLELGARHLDIGQRPEEGHVVLADPEGNEYCVIEPGNNFLADCGFVGALACDGSQRVGYFWRDALAWPLVWDEGEETAIRSPRGGPKITWGGPPFAPKTGPNRLRFELAADDQPAEADRLVSLGATVLDAGPDLGGAVLMADPDGNEFVVTPADDLTHPPPTSPGQDTGGRDDGS